MAIWTDDPAHDAAMHDLEQEAANCRMLGVCEFCLEPVTTTDNYMKGSDGQYAHLECVKEAAERINNYLGKEILFLDTCLKKGGMTYL